MNTPLSPLTIRSLTLLLPLTAVWLLWLWRSPTTRQQAGIFLACAWLTSSLFCLNLAAMRLGWWRFEGDGGVILGLPLDLLIGWVLLWGALPHLAWPRLPLPLLVVLLCLMDVLTMPLAAPVIQLGPLWLVGEIVALAVCLLPAQLLARWTTAQTRLPLRAALLGVIFGATVLGLLPALIIELTGGKWEVIWQRPLWHNSLMLQLLAVPTGIGLSAVQEFVNRGNGTPLPFDPPQYLVTSGLYAYVANPMQLATTLIFLGLGWVLQSPWVALAGGVTFVYSAGLASWSEGGDMRERYGTAWDDYRRHVGHWLPRWRPYIPEGQEQARLYIAATCQPCSQLWRWLEKQSPAGLAFTAAEHHPSQALTRLTYEPAGYGRAETGVAAFARAIEHIHLGWALLGVMMRLPGLRPWLQLLVDAVGGDARPLCEVG